MRHTDTLRHEDALVAEVISEARFRELCGRFPTGVAVITAVTAEGEPAGITANSFVSVSLRPPLISVNIDEQAEMHRVLSAARHFVVNILEASQEAISRRFSENRLARFDGLPYHRNAQGIPVLEATIATLECEAVQEVDAGDHRIFIARVTGGEAREGRPLLYFRGGYGGWPSGAAG